MQEALRAYLAGDTALAALVSTRIAWGMSDQGSALPRVVLQKISGNPEYSDEGEAGLSEARVQVDCYAETYAGAIAISRAIRDRVSGANFTQGAVTFDVFIDSERDSTEMFEGGRKVHRVSIDLMVWNNG